MVGASRGGGRRARSGSRVQVVALCALAASAPSQARAAEPDAHLPRSAEPAPRGAARRVQLVVADPLPREAATLITGLQAAVGARLSMAAAALYQPGDAQPRPGAFARASVIRAPSRGLDLGVAVGYGAPGLDLTPAAAARLVGEWTSGRGAVLATVGFAVGPRSRERHGDAQLTVVRRIGGNAQVGLRSMARLDLERDADEPAGETDWEAIAGPMVSYALGPFSATASCGATALRARLAPATHLGVVANLGIAAAY